LVDIAAVRGAVDQDAVVVGIACEIGEQIAWRIFWNREPFRDGAALDFLFLSAMGQPHRPLAEKHLERKNRQTRRRQSWRCGRRRRRRLLLGLFRDARERPAGRTQRLFERTELVRRWLLAWSDRGNETRSAGVLPAPPSANSRSD